jgi:hypothetical protein
MDYRGIDLAKLRVNEALKMGLESQRAYRAMHANESLSLKNSTASLRTMLLVAKCYIQLYSEKFYCRTLEFFH